MDLSEPFFSIVTVCFNSEKTIRRTIESLLAQTNQDFEYIVVDGASTDDTLKIVNEYADTFGERLKIVSEPDDGIYDAMNKGIAIASGHFVGILNSDDYYENNALELVKNASSGAEYEIVYGMIRVLLEGAEVRCYMNSPHFIEKAMIAHPGCFIANAVYRQFGLYSLDYKIVSDYEFFLRNRKEERITYTPIYDILTNFSMGGISDGVEVDYETLRLRYEYGLISVLHYYTAVMMKHIKAKLRFLR